MPSKEFWPLLCHPCSLMSSSRKQKDSPTEKNVTMTELWQVLWMVYLQSSSLMWKKKKPSLTDQADLSSCTAQHSSPLHIPDSPATDAHRGSEEEVLLLQKSNSQVLTCPIHTTPWHQFRNVSFWWSNSCAQNLLKQLQGVKQLAPQGSLTPLQGGCKLQHLAWMWEQNDSCVKGTPQPW